MLIPLPIQIMQATITGNTKYTLKPQCLRPILKTAKTTYDVSF